MQHENRYSLEITESFLFEFYKHYDKLGTKQKKIFQFVQWYCRRFPAAFPRQETIAERVGCTRKHVNRTLQVFQNLGWLYLCSRGCKRSKILCLVDSLVVLQISKRQYFRKTEVTTQVTHSSSKAKHKASGGLSFLGIERSENETLTIPDFLQKAKLSLDQKLKLSMLPESYYRRAIETTDYKMKSGKLPKDRERLNSYMVGAAIGMAKKDNYQIPWRKYYQSLK